MDLAALEILQPTGPLAAERRVLLHAGLQQIELAMTDCEDFTREDLADHSILLTAAVEHASVVSARFAAVAQEQACGLTKGQPSMAAALNSEARISRKRGAQLDLVGSAPDRYGIFYQSLLDGDISLGHIEVLHPVWRVVDGLQFAAAEKRLAELAAMCTPEEFRSYLGEWRNHADEDGALDEYLRNQAKQHFQYGFDLFGNVHYSGTVGPECAEPFVETIETEARVPVAEAKLPSQRLGDAVVELILNPDGKYRAQLEILSFDGAAEVQRAETLADLAKDPDRLLANQTMEEHWSFMARTNRIRDRFDQGFNTIHGARTARGTHVPAAVVERLQMDGARVRTHAVNSAGNIVGDRDAGRHFNTLQKTLIRLRDNRCRHIGCRRTRCEYDHIVPAERSGPTLIRNGQLLCRFHHRYKHRRDRHGSTVFDDSLVHLE